MANALKRNLEESSSISIDSFCPTPNGVGTHPSIIGKCIMFFGNNSNKLKQLINEWFFVDEHHESIKNLNKVATIHNYTHFTEQECKLISTLREHYESLDKRGTFSPVNLSD